MPPLDLRGWGKVTGGGAPANPYTPATIPGLLATFDPAAPYVTKAGTPERVSSFFSRDGVYELVQASGPAQLEWSATGILGKPAVYGDGARFIAATIALAGLLDASASMSAVCITDLDASAGASVFWGIGDSGASNNLVQVYASGASRQLNMGRFVPAGNTVTTNASALVGTSPEYSAVFYDGSSGSFNVGGTDWAGGANTRAPACDMFSLGAARFAGAYTNYLRGWLGPVWIYDHPLTAGERTTLWNFIVSEYPGI